MQPGLLRKKKRKKRQQRQADFRVILLDNRYVENSSSPIVERDANGNSYQSRILKNGETHRVLKNFPDAVFETWPFFWAFEYEVI